MSTYTVIDGKKVDNRKRNFGSIVYPESAYEGWREFLNDLHVECFISPLHDQDINPDGSQKKPHYHILLMFDGKKDPDVIQRDIWDKIGAVGNEFIGSARGYARYLCHLDNPEKAYYDPDQVLALGGADYFNICSLPKDRYKAIGEMLQFIIDNNIVYYSDLLLWCHDNKYDWFRVLCDSGTYVIKEFVRSQSYKMQQYAKNDIEVTPIELIEKKND